MLKPGWFPEYLPWEQKIFDEIQNIVHQVSQKMWYLHIWTPAVEKNEILLKWWEESSKQIFGLYGLAQWVEDVKGYSLHFDLTVPLARYVIEHEQELAFPFKRVQVQPVRRWERSQRWRFKEFWQADIDIIWRWSGEKSTKNIFYDAEVMIVAQKILKDIKTKFAIDNMITMHINNRKLAQWFADFILDNEQDKKKLFKLFDDYYKMWNEKFVSQVENITQDADLQQKIFEYTKLNLDSISSEFAPNGLFKQWLDELKQVFSFLKKMDNRWEFGFVFDPMIMRWLDYYTGTVYETFVDWDLGLGSVYSGGRYENLTKSISNNQKDFEWVGISMWISRICTLIWEQQKNQKSNQEDSFLFLNFENTIDITLKLYSKFIEENKICEMFPNSDKISKQYNYAEKKWISHVVILWENEEKNWKYQIKNLKTGEITSYDLDI